MEIPVRRGDDVAVAVAKHLELDVPRLDQGTLQGNEPSPKALVAPHGRYRTRFQVLLGGTMRMPRPPPPAAGFENNWITMRAASAVASSASASGPLLPGSTGTRPAPRLRAAALVAHQADGSRARADPAQAALPEHLGEVRVFRQEAVARMHRIGAGDLGGRNDRGNVQVARGGLRRADAHLLVGIGDVQAVAVRGRIHGHRGNAELAAGADHAQRDFSAIRDQDFLEHAGPVRLS